MLGIRVIDSLVSTATGALGTASMPRLQIRQARPGPGAVGIVVRPHRVTLDDRQASSHHAEPTGGHGQIHQSVILRRLQFKGLNNWCDKDERSHGSECLIENLSSLNQSSGPNQDIPSLHYSRVSWGRVLRRQDRNRRTEMADEPLLLSVTEAAALLGVSRSMAYNLVRRGILPHVELGPGHVLQVPRAGLERWVEESTRGSYPTSTDDRPWHPPTRGATRSSRA